MSERLTKAQIGMLSMFSIDTYCIDIHPSADREALVVAGLLEWVPPPTWHGNHTYGITDAGRAILRSIEGGERG